MLVGRLLLLLLMVRVGRWVVVIVGRRGWWIWLVRVVEIGRLMWVIVRRRMWWRLVIRRRLLVFRLMIPLLMLRLVVEWWWMIVKGNTA